MHKIDNWCCVWQALEHREAALKLAEHWKEEAIKQAKFAQVRIFSNFIRSSITSLHMTLAASLFAILWHPMPSVRMRCNKQRNVCKQHEAEEMR